MAEKSTLAQAVQIGVEVTPGTGVAADKLLQSLSITPGIKAEVEAFRANGYKWPMVAIPGKEWSEAKVEGKPTYAEIVYLLSSVLTTGVVTEPVPLGLPRLWTFSPASVGADTPKTFTVENGEAGAGNGRRTVGNIMTELGLKVSRGEVTVDGTFLGKALETGLTMTAAPTALPLLPIIPGHFTAFLDTSAAALGTTKLTRAFSIEATIGDRYAPVWPIDATLVSYADTVETKPKGEVKLKIAADAAGIDLLPPMRAGDSRFLRLLAEGPVIETTYKNSATFDFALKVTGVGEFSDEDGVYCLEYTFALMHDATWGRALQVVVQNTLDAL